MPKSTFAEDDQKQDELNVSQRHADQLAQLAGTEKRGTVNVDDFERNYGENADSSQEDANIKKARDGERSSAPSASWRNETSEPDAIKGKGKRKKVWFKRSAPALGIGGLIGIGALLMVGLASPSLLVVQLKETMVGRFNTQLSAMEARTNKIIYAKMNGATSGFCNANLTIRCKYTTMSEKQVEKLKAAGIEVESDSKTVTGRVKVKSLVFNEKTITAATFATTAGTDSAFRNALKQAYNPKYAGFVGKAWANAAAKYKISKQLPELNADEDPEKARAKINEIAKEGTEDTGSRVRVDGDPDCNANTCFSDADADSIDNDVGAIDEAGKNGTAADAVRARLSSINTGAVASFFKLSAPLDYACQGYGALTTLSYAGKAIRAAQLVRYSMIFVGVADAIKAGVSPEPEDVELLGDILTTTLVSTDDPTKQVVGAATDSFGYRYAAYLDTGGSPQSMDIANRFIAGGGFVGELSAITGTVMAAFGGSRDTAKQTCGFLANPIVQGASIVLGIAALFVPGANVGKIVTGAVGGVAIGTALAILPNLLADIIAGTVTKDIVGEESGNAIASGAGALMSDTLAGQNGNAPMTKTDAIAYSTLQAQTTDQYIADELLETSPFDATNPHTFIGSIAAKLIPLQSKSNPLSSLGSLLSTSIGSLTPKSSALTTEEYDQLFGLCKDLDVVEVGYAADPFCNIIRGIPPQYLDRDPLEVVEWLIANGYLTSDETQTQKYTDFINKCMLSEEPLGYANPDTGFDPAAAKDCIITNANANLYLGFMDSRIELGLSDEDKAETVTNSTAGVAIDMANLYEDSVDIACATNTIDKGVNTGYVDGRPFQIRLCGLPNSSEPSKVEYGGIAVVNSRVSGAVYAMLEQMKKDIGVGTIPFGDSYRSPEQQQAAINSCGLYANGGCAAAQGYSNHQSGVALDFEYTNQYCAHSRGITSCPASPYWTWLSQNASKFGYNNGVDEWWHWSPTGQ